MTFKILDVSPFPNYINLDGRLSIKTFSVFNETSQETELTTLLQL